MKVTIDHVGIAVADLDAGAVVLSRRARARGRDARGGRVAARAGALHPGGGVRHRAARGHREDSPIAKFVAKRGPGLHHITLRVDDIGAALAQLKAKGVRLIDESPREGAHGSLVAFIHPSSAHGVLVELKQMP